MLLAQTLYTLVKSSPIKCKYLRLESSWVKIRQTSFCQFWNNMSVPLQIFRHSSVSLHIFSLGIFYFGQKNSTKVSILTLSSVLIKICQIPYVIFQTTRQFFLHDSSVPWNITPLYVFRLIVIYFAQKWPIKV